MSKIADPRKKGAVGVILHFQTAPESFDLSIVPSRLP